MSYFNPPAGIGTYVATPNAMNTHGVTMSAWIYMDGNPHSGLIMGLAGANGNTISLGVGAGTFNDDQPTQLVTLTEGVCWMTGTTNMGAGWHHVALEVLADGTVQMYLDGAWQNTWYSCAPQASAPTGTPIVSGAYGRALKGVFVSRNATFYNSAKGASFIASQSSVGR